MNNPITNKERLREEIQRHIEHSKKGWDILCPSYGSMGKCTDNILALFDKQLEECLGEKRNS